MAGYAVKWSVDVDKRMLLAVEVLLREVASCFVGVSLYMKGQKIFILKLYIPLQNLFHVFLDIGSYFCHG